ncbi:tetratricopeptide repeat protein [Pseudolabrys sp.]|uniref:tetratricopeptide repeat protein n=1 Tax=Pseudolabrys sp. TaxID=1960880 RepID=UPI003D119A01
MVGWVFVRCCGERARTVFRAARCIVPALLAVLTFVPPAHADPVRGDVRVTTDRGYARLVFRLDEQVDARIHLSGTVLILDFKKPIDVAVDRLNAAAPDYISAGRLDPDGKAVRLALVRGYRINMTPAAERLFVDILPTDWQGMLPGLPQEVIDELARRTREAERQLRQQRLFGKKQNDETVPVKVGTQPTFTRYVFDLPNFANVVPERSQDKLTLNFDQSIKYDLADAKAAMPPTLQSVDAEVEHDSVAVSFVFKGEPDVRLFREDRSVVIDIDNGGAATETEKMTENGFVETSPDGAIKAPALTAPETVPSAQKDQKDKDRKDKASAGGKPQTALPPSAVAVADMKPASDGLPGQPIVPNNAATAMAEPGGDTVPGAKPAAATVRMKLDTPDAAAKAATAVEEAMRLMGGDKAPPPQVQAPQTQASQTQASQPQTSQPQAPQTPAPQAEAAATPPQVAPAVSKAAPDMPKAAERPAAPQAVAKAESVTPPAAALPPTAPPPVAAPATTPAAAKPAPDAARAKSAVNKPAVTVTPKGDTLVLNFPFSAATPAAAFQRAETLWLVFDSEQPLDFSAIRSSGNATLRHVALDDSRPGETIVRIRLERPRLATLAPAGNGWSLTIGDASSQSVAPLTVTRSLNASGQPTITIPFANPAKVHRLTDPDIGDKLLVVTALGPARGFLKPQTFVELRALSSAHGVVVQPLADDVAAKLSPDKIIISRPDGLTLSSSIPGNIKQAEVSRSYTFDPQTWGFNRQAAFYPRQAELIADAASAPEARRRDARLDLARFYLARDLVTEAKAVIDVVLQDEPPNSDDVTGKLMMAIANVMLDRPNEALKELASPVVGEQHDAPLWRAVALAKQGRWEDAREAFKASAALLGTIPIELQRLVMLSALRSYIETRDFTAASKVVNDFEAIGASAEVAPELAVQTGRLDEALGKKDEALARYRAAAESDDRRAAAQGRLRELVLRFKSDEIKRANMVAELERLTATWRGDETEAEGLKLLAHFYTQDGRFRDAFHVMRVALLAHPNSDLTRKIHDEAAATFGSLFLGGKGDALPPIEALGLFYDYRDLTPIGRRGDEMIRRLAERLIAVDLLEQASELLDYQVTHRLQGAARAQVATRLAIVYLMAHKADRALATLRTTRISGLSTELRSQRLLLEARALSSIGRHDLAIEVIASMKGNEVIRLRSDIYWAAKKWREAAEQIELLYGERWKDFTPLTEAERGDILRAALGYALAEDAIGLAAFRDKYAAKMIDSPSRMAFETITGKQGVNSPEFREVASVVAAQNTLGAFLDAVRARFPDATKQEPAPAEPPQATPAPQPPGEPRVEAPASAPANTTANSKPDPAPTGSIGSEAHGLILPPRPPRGVKLTRVPPPQIGVPRLPRVSP